MLDVSIHRSSNGSLSFDVYRKPTHTNQYIPFESHAPLSHKLATVRSLTRRASLIPSTEEKKKEENVQVKKALAINGYPRWAYDLARHRETDPQPPTTFPTPPTATSPPSPTTSSTPPSTTPATTAPATTTTTTNTHKGFVTMPYYSGTTEPLTHIMQRAGISAQIRARGTLRETLVKSKDKVKSGHKTGIIYFTPCAGANGEPCDSGAAYVGETSRQGRQRFKEHCSTAKLYTGDYKSAVMQHAAETGHSFREEDLTILDSDDNWRSRGIRESVYIRALNPSLNRRSERNDRYTLPATYDSIIKGTIKPPLAPRPHQPTEKKTFTGDRRPGRQRRATEAPTTTTTTTPTSTETIAKTVTPASGHHMLTRRMARASAGDRDTPD